jgi:hypothetical protein
VIFRSAFPRQLTSGESIAVSTPNGNRPIPVGKSHSPGYPAHFYSPETRNVVKAKVALLSS